MTTYPSNTVAKYTTRLPSVLELNGQWEVGLSEIIYSRSWYNIDKQDCYFELLNESGNSFLTLPLQTGYYEDVQDVISCMNAMMEKTMSAAKRAAIDINYIDRTKKVSITISSAMGFKLSTVLAQILGFEKRELICEANGVGRRYIGTVGSDVNRGFATLFVYCDLAQETIVGDTKAPLLRTLNIEGSYGDIIQKVYANPIYIPLQRTHFDTIEVNIRTETGQLVPFASGKSVLTLHIRRATSTYFLSR